jgi:N-methylhydantoinase B/oxoprolinase/acetone carboxylase alpha subunit
VTDELDPVTVEVIRNKLEGIADEMEITLLKSSHSTIVKEALDASAAIFDAAGNQLAQAIASPIHLGMILPAVQRFVELFPPEAMHEGDVYVLNDPFDGGTHLPDLVMAMPIMVEDAPIGLAVAITHHQEMGGRSAGSTPMDATEIFQEGLRIPPLKLYDRGEPNATFFAMLERNVRIPAVVRGDLDGQLAACVTGARGVRLLAAHHGVRPLLRYMDELLRRAEEMTRAAIARIPDGTYHFVDYLDHDGFDLDHRIRIEVTIRVDGSELLVDLSGSERQVRGPINCVPASTLAAIYYVVKVITDPSIPNNAGCYRPVHAHLPAGSIVNADPPAAVNARAVVVRRIVDAMLGALAPALPDRIPSASSGHPLVCSMGGVDPATGRAFVTSEVGTGGMGARPGKDGVDCIQTDTSNAQNVPVEALELEFPLRVGYFRLRTESGGPGRFRGGLGFEKSFQALRGAVGVSHRGERHLTAPWGLFGGGAGATAKSRLVRADGTVELFPSKAELRLQPGDWLEVWTTGGGGHGDPLERDAELVLADVLDRKVSTQQAADAYGVVIVDGRVDPEATDKRRAAMAEARGPVSWTYDRGALGRE